MDHNPCFRIRMEAGGAWGHLQQLNVHFTPEKFSLSRKENTIYCRKRSFRGKPATEGVISLLLPQQSVTAQGPSHPAPFHCSIFVNRQKGHLMHTLCYQNRKEAKKSPLRVRLFSLLTLYCPQKAPFYLRSSQWSNMEREMDGSWSGE